MPPDGPGAGPSPNVTALVRSPDAPCPVLNGRSLLCNTEKSLFPAQRANRHTFRAQRSGAQSGHAARDEIATDDVFIVAGSSKYLLAARRRLEIFGVDDVSEEEQAAVSRAARPSVSRSLP